MLARYVKFPVMGDDKGWLVSLEGRKSVPFPIERAYYIFGTQAGVTRGKHAHHQLRQLMLCLAGSCKVLLDDGVTREEAPMSTDNRGLFIDPMVWHEMHDFSEGCVLLVLADAWYDTSDYIRDYTQFKALARQPQ
jgi:dTDP-4-dehydrorhamnose 3,5-epimerase-like enzyme